MNRYVATLMPSSLPLPDLRSSPTFPVKGRHPVNGQSSATTPKVVGSMLFDHIKVCWVHQFGDASEEVPFATIVELEKLDEEEGEGWGLRWWIEDGLARRTRAIGRWRC